MCAVALELDDFNVADELFNVCATDLTVMVGWTVIPFPPLAADRVCCMELSTAWAWLADGLEACPGCASALLEFGCANDACDNNWKKLQSCFKMFCILQFHSL